MSAPPDYQQISNNCYKLAEILRNVPDAQHNQAVWVVDNRPECGTTCCAMGWAALSGEFEGLSVAPDTARVHYLPRYLREYGLEGVTNQHTQAVLNEETMPMEMAATRLFGRAVTGDVFLNIDRNKQQTIERLEFYGDHFCDLAKKGKQPPT